MRHVRVDPLALADTIRQELRKRDQDLAVSKVRPMAAYMDRAKAPVSFTAVLAGVFAGLALLLAASAFTGWCITRCRVACTRWGCGWRWGQRRRRGAPGDARGQAGANGMGMILGVAGSLYAAQYLQALIYGIAAVDPITYGVAMVVIPAAALLGCWRPAWIAGAANPVDAIRAE
jgi:ABC-type antimicrobial peptide transport system permease subunit